MNNNHARYLCVIILICLTIIITLTGCGKKEEYNNPNTSYVKNGVLEEIAFEETEDITNYVKLETKKKEIVLIELIPSSAPVTVENFQKLVSNKFYDNLTFHRVVKSFVIQTGDPTATGGGGSEKKIKGEFLANGVENPTSHTKGVVSMARNSVDYNSASSQFFICVEDAKYLDGNYASFGKVIAGMDTVDRISKVSVDNYDKPLEDEVINTIRFVNIN